MITILVACFETNSVEIAKLGHDHKACLVTSSPILPMNVANRAEH